MALSPPAGAGPWDNARPPSTPAAHAARSRFQTTPGDVRLQVESHPDLATTLKRARLYSLTFEHTAAFETTTGWYAIVIGVAQRNSAGTILETLKAAAAIPDDSLFTTGSTYLVQIWPPDATTGVGDLDAAIARERSWSLETRKRVQNALIWTDDYNGVLDGEIGPRTREAIRSFQRRHGFLATGYLTGEQIAQLEALRIAAVHAAGFEIVDDYETGIRIGLPRAMFRRGARDGPFIQFDPVPGQPPASLSLLSVRGGLPELRWLFDLVRREVGTGPRTYSVLKDNWFVLSGSSGGATTYRHRTTPFWCAVSRSRGARRSEAARRRTSLYSTSALWRHGFGALVDTAPRPRGACSCFPRQIDSPGFSRWRRAV